MAGKSTLSDERIRQIEILALKGFTDAEMADVIGVTEQTFNNWKTQKPSFFESLKDWKIQADSKVEVSLYEKATGYEHPETKLFKTSEDKIISEEVTRHYPPDTTAMIFWLKNRKKKVWRDRTEIDMTTREAELTDEQLASQIKAMEKKLGTNKER
jgi:transcriptional regulator with XRE-family HTH domain